MYFFNNLIYDGKNSQIYEAINKESDKKVIAKITKRKKEERVIKEILALKTIKNNISNTAQLLDFGLTSSNSYKHLLVIIKKIFENFGDQNLKEFISSKNEYKKNDIKLIIKSLLTIVNNLHKEGLIHRDIKPSNIIISSETKEIRLIDFGITSFYIPNQEINPKLGTFYFKSPEQLLNFKKCFSGLQMLEK